MTLPTIDHHLFTVPLCDDPKGLEEEEIPSRWSHVFEICHWAMPSLKALRHGTVNCILVSDGRLPALSAHYVLGAQTSLALFQPDELAINVMADMLQEIEQIRSEISHAELRREHGIQMSNELANLSGDAFAAKIIQIRQHFAEDAQMILRMRRSSLKIDMQGSEYTIKAPELPAYVVQPREIHVTARILDFNGDTVDLKIVQVSQEDCAAECADLMKKKRIPMYRPSRTHVHYAHWFALAAVANIRGSLELVVRTGHADWFSTKVRHFELVEILDVPTLLNTLARETARALGTS